MANEMTVNNTQVPAVPKAAVPGCIERTHRYPVVDEERAGKIMDEVIGSIKDTRLDTKRAIFADIAVTAREQNQNDRLLAAYENELRRKDLPEGRREEILNEMSRIATISANASVESRVFQSEQLDREHKLSRWIIGGPILLIGGGVGGVAWASRRA